MKFLRYRQAGHERIGVLNIEEGAVIAVSDVLDGKQYESMIRLIEEISEEELKQLQAACGRSPQSTALEQVQVLAPVERPIHDVICVGVNYKDHLEETKESAGGFEEAPKKPVYFGKRAIRILGPGEEIESKPELDEALDYEVELAVIIGKRGVNIPKEQAEDYIFGYSVFNDISSRTLQMSHVQWYRGKSLDTYTAMGPVILHKSALPFPVEVDVRSFVNGEERQSSNTRLFLTDIPALIADLSSGMTLEPGDIIATGTPAGVGMGFHPARYMKSGDEVICEIPPIGRLVNRVK